MKIESWFIEEAQRRTKDFDFADVVIRLSRGRQKNWDPTTVRNFLRGEHTTEEMALAFVREFSIPLPVYYPRSFAEADRMRLVAADYDPPPDRVQVLDAIVDEIARDADDQTGAVTSPDEPQAKRRSNRGMGRGGSTTS